MTTPVRPHVHGRRPVDPVGDSQPRPAPRPKRCAYCNEDPPSILCGPEHTAYAAEWLCTGCYRRLFKGPVLVPQAEQERHDGGESYGRRA
jgi:hypothetical protein